MQIFYFHPYFCRKLWKDVLHENEKQERGRHKTRENTDSNTGKHQGKFQDDNQVAKQESNRSKLEKEKKTFAERVP